MEALGINLGSFIFQIINFVIILWAINKFALPKVQAALDERKSKISQSLKDAELIEKRLKKVEQEVDERLDKASKKADQIIAEAKKTGTEVQSKIKQEAEDQAVRILQKNEERMAQKEAEMMARVEERIVQLTQTATEKVLTQYLSKSDREKITQQALKQVDQVLS